MLTREEIVKTLYADLSARTDRPKMPFGLEDLDKLTWGAHKKELMVVAARPSMGKTSIMLNMAKGLVRAGKSVIILTLEMSKMAIYERLMCIEYGLHGWKLRTGNPLELQKAQALETDFLHKLIKWPLEVFDQEGKTIESVEQVLKDFCPDALFIDYVQKISSKGFGNKYEAVSNYVVKLQSLAIQYDCAVILSSQLNRGGSKQENAMDNMKSSGEIEESADTLLQCRWLAREDNARLDQKEYIVNAIKQRHGPCDYITLDFDAASFRFETRAHIDFNERMACGKN